MGEWDKLVDWLAKEGEGHGMCLQVDEGRQRQG
jgi:hypothetical protein